MQVHKKNNDSRAKERRGMGKQSKKNEDLQLQTNNLRRREPN